MRSENLILLVEDNDAHAQLVTIGLNEAPTAHSVIRVEDGVQALDYLRLKGRYANISMKKPDLILLDLRLPKIDGITVLKEIKNDESLMNIPVVVLTTSGDELDIAAAYENGANGYLVKPMLFGELSVMLTETIYYWLECSRR